MLMAALVGAPPQNSHQAAVQPPETRQLTSDLDQFDPTQVDKVDDFLEIVDLDDLMEPGLPPLEDFFYDPSEDFLDHMLLNPYQEGFNGLHEAQITTQLWEHDQVASLAPPPGTWLKIFLPV